MQMLERPWGVAVVGTASVKAEPDLARIRFRVVRTKEKPAAAFDVVRAGVRAVRTALRAHGVDDAAVEASQLSLATLTNYVDGASVVVGYQCQAAFSVEFGVLEDVETLLVDLVAAGANEIDGVGYDVAGRSALVAEARRAAVADARATAELLAAAAGVRLGAVLHLEEADSAGPQASRLLAADTGRDLPPGTILVSAAVTVGFALAGE